MSDSKWTRQTERRIRRLSRRVEAQSLRPFADRVELTSILGRCEDLLGSAERILFDPNEWTDPGRIGLNLSAVEVLLRQHERERTKAVNAKLASDLDKARSWRESR